MNQEETGVMAIAGRDLAFDHDVRTRTLAVWRPRRLCITRACSCCTASRRT